MSALPDTADPAPRARRPVGLLIVVVTTAGAITFGVVAGRLGFGAPLVMLGLGGLTLGLAALALWKVLDPLLRPEAARAEPPRAPARLRELEREKQMVLKAIKEIELDHEMRKVSDADWKELTQRYRARAMRLIAELDAGDDFRALIEQELKARLAARASGNAGACPACGVVNDGDALFCKKCGKKLREGADA